MPLALRAADRRCPKSGAAFVAGRGAEIATEVGNAHENEVPQEVQLATFFDPEADERADSRADLLNNETGREVAAGLPNASNIDLANRVLDAFHNTGLVTTAAQPDGSVRTVVTRITDAQYQKAQRLLGQLNHNGFTPAQQAQWNAERVQRVETLNHPRD